ncbi:hypothetical protein Mal64_33050 [Pseudobythopirellula maris]|uniref:UPF0246 protein Mal64_33050 n=1 Tax=Pseudobythopirellula maris TaxID=2527991 RepID=A0A5C5ZH84_9BACT|nr:peroxide stress protein YaaA [Pseudobythopirellula maris]TWT86480.1 hypothetical protein Mal64_33050 [Pseudobythopirellula maris]
MLILLSPAKTLDFSPAEDAPEATKPALHAEAKRLAATAKELSPAQIKKLMGVSDNLAGAAHGYFADWRQKWDARGAKQALLAFRGDVYQGLDADTLSADQLRRAQDSLRILSGLYGVLRPLDLIQPYRLEMGLGLKNERGKSVYEFWGDRVTKRLAADLEAAPAGEPPLVVNLASQEYAGVVDFSALGESGAEVITPAFKDLSKGKYRVVSFFAKRARGAMARHLIERGAKGPSAIKSFKTGGYRYNAELSTASKPVFTRDKPPAAKAG